MSMNIYLAHPIDQVKDGLGASSAGMRATVERVVGELQSAGCTVYRPQQAFDVGDEAAGGLTVEAAEFIGSINRLALSQCDGMFAILPAGVQTLGCPLEIESQVALGVPVAVWCEQMTPSVVLLDWQRRGAFVGTDHKELVALLTEKTRDAKAQAQAWTSAAASSDELLRDLEQRGYEQALAQALHPSSTFFGPAGWEPHPEAAPTIKWVGPGREPTKARPGDAGYDLYVSRTKVLMPGEFADIPCDVRIELPEGWWGLLTGRSSTLRRKGLLVAQGVIDQGYRGELFAGVKNLGTTPAEVKEGERIAQLIPVPLWQGGLERVEELGESDRGVAGFGSTGS